MFMEQLKNLARPHNNQLPPLNSYKVAAKD